MAQGTVDYDVKHNIIVGSIITQVKENIPNISAAEFDDVVLRLIRRYYRLIFRRYLRTHDVDEANVQREMLSYYDNIRIRLYLDAGRQKLMAEHNFTVHTLNIAEMSLTDRIFQPDMFGDRSLEKMADVFSKHLGHSRTRKFTKERFKQLEVDDSTKISLLCHILNRKSMPWYCEADCVDGPRSLLYIGGDPYLIHLTHQQKSGCDVVELLALAKKFIDEYPSHRIFEMNCSNILDLT